MKRGRPCGSHSDTEGMGRVQEQPFHGAGRAGLTWRRRARGGRGYGLGEAAQPLDLKGPVGSRCVEMGGRGEPSKGLRGDSRAPAKNRPLGAAAQRRGLASEQSCRLPYVSK